MFREDDPPCYEPQTAVVDTHVRLRPFGGVAIPSEETVSGFMEVLRERGIPLAIHADLGNDEEPVSAAPLIQEMLRLYPENTIVWTRRSSQWQQASGSSSIWMPSSTPVRWRRCWTATPI